MLPAQNESLQWKSGERTPDTSCVGAVGLALSPVLPANVYPVLVEVPPDGVHDGSMVHPCGLQPDVLEAVVYVPQGNPVATTEQEPGSDDDNDRGRNGRDRRDCFTHGDLHSQRYPLPPKMVNRGIDPERPGWPCYRYDADPR